MAMLHLNTDFSALEGTNCYCSAESAVQIRQRISSLPLHAFHTIGTGDYHYQTLFWLERIREPFALLLLDWHPDDQPDAFGAGMLSCGNWVAEARRLPNCRFDYWVRCEADFLSPEALPPLPVYLSIDLDILSPAFARTDWDQGSMSLEALTRFLQRLAAAHRILGVDLCGGLSDTKGASPEDLALNASTGEAIYYLFQKI